MEHGSDRSNGWLRIMPGNEWYYLLPFCEQTMLKRLRDITDRMIMLSYCCE